MFKINLPVWLREKPHINALKNAFVTWWGKVQEWLSFPLLQQDAITCHPFILQLLAWQRDITRFRNEPELLYRLRVDSAILNVIDAGSQEGFFCIFERLGIQLNAVLERQPELEWDEVYLHIVDSEFTSQPELMQFITNVYGRTCRRYRFLLVEKTPPIYVHAIDAVWDQQTHTENITL